MLTNHLINIKTLTDSHLEEFIRCPYKFYQHELLKSNKKLNWRQVVQLSVNQIVNEYFRTPVSKRSTYKILSLIDKYWKPVTVDLFQSKASYYLVLAKVSDYLVQFLLKEKNSEPPLFLYEKQHVFVEQLDMSLSIRFEVAEWNDTSFVVKKYLLDDHVSFLQTFKSMMLVFSKHAFQKLPDRIEIYSLMSGKVIEYLPQESDVEKALYDLKLMKHVLESRKSYQKTNSSECISCHLHHQCSQDLDQPIEEKEQTILYM